MPVDNYPNASDWQLLKDGFQANLGWQSRSVVFKKFQGYSMRGTGPAIEQHRVPSYVSRAEVVWLQEVRVYDTVKGGYFTTGDLNMNSFFQVRGFSPAYSIPGGNTIDEYAGDEIIWNGRVWIPSDQIEPRPFGPRSGTVFWRTVLRASTRNSQGLSAGPA